MFCKAERQINNANLINAHFNYLLRSWQKNGIIVHDVGQHSWQHHKDAEDNAIDLLAPATKAMAQHQHHQAQGKGLRVRGQIPALQQALQIRKDIKGYH